MRVKYWFNESDCNSWIRLNLIILLRMHLMFDLFIYSRLKRTRRVPLNSPRRPRRRKRVDLVEKLRRRFVHPFTVIITMDNFKLSHLMHIFSTWSTVEAKTDLMSLMRFDENFLVIFSIVIVRIIFMRRSFLYSCRSGPKEKYVTS